MRAERLRRDERIRHVLRIAVDVVRLLDAAARLRPADDDVAIRLGQPGVRADVVQRFAVGKEPAALGPAGMLAREGELLRVDRARRRAPVAPPPCTG